MNIGIDLLAINRVKGHGIGYYTENFCQTLIKEKKNNNYFFINWSTEPMASELFALDSNSCELCLGERCYDDADIVEVELGKFIRDNAIDIYIDFSPLWGERPRLKHRWFGEKCKLYGIVYDFIPYVLSESYYATNEHGYFNYVRSVYNLHQYDHLFTISDNTKTDANIIAGYPMDRMTTIYCGCSWADEDM